MANQESPPKTPVEPLTVGPHTMQRNSNSENDADNSDRNNQPANYKVVWAITVGGGILVLVILFVSIFWPHLAERTKFFTTNALSALVLVLIAIQSYIYTKQWEAMRGQLEELREQRESFKEQLSVMRNQARAAEEQARVLRSLVHSTDDQLAVMRHSSYQTQTMIEHNAKAVKAAQKQADTAEQAMIHAQRAYVTIPRGNVTTLEDGSQIFNLELTNDGNTPANHVFIFELAGYIEHTSPGEAVPPNRFPAYIGLIAPGCQITRNSKKIKPVSNPDWPLRCIGVIGYTDAFGRSRETKFCVEQDRVEPSRFGPCTLREHNHAG